MKYFATIGVCSNVLDYLDTSLRDILMKFATSLFSCIKVATDDYQNQNKLS